MSQLNVTDQGWNEHQLGTVSWNWVDMFGHPEVEANANTA